MVSDVGMTTIRRATLADLKYIDYLRKREGEAVGFIPIERYKKEIDGRRQGSIYLAFENDDPVGFIYATHNRRAGVTRIQQVAIQEDARRMERATALVDTIMQDGDWLLSLRCAADLEATAFWGTLGFRVIRDEPPKSGYGRGREKATLPTRRKRRILRFQKVISGLWLPEEARELAAKKAGAQQGVMWE